MRHRRHVLHEPDEELGATDCAELVRRGELLLHRLERDRVPACGHAIHRAEHELVVVAGQIWWRQPAAHEWRVQRVVDEDRAEEGCFRVGILGRRLRRVARDVERHTGMPSSSLRLKNRACSASKYSSKRPVGPLRFFPMLPWISLGAPGGDSSLSFQSIRTMSASCSKAPELWDTIPSASQDDVAGTVRS